MTTPRRPRRDHIASLSLLDRVSLLTASFHMPGRDTVATRLLLGVVIKSKLQRSCIMPQRVSRSLCLHFYPFRRLNLQSQTRKTNRKGKSVPRKSKTSSSPPRKSTACPSQTPQSQAGSPLLYTPLGRGATQAPWRIGPHIGRWEFWEPWGQGRGG